MCSSACRDELGRQPLALPGSSPRPELIAHLGALGLEVRDLGVVLNARKMLDAAGGVMAAIERPHLMAAWEHIYRVLRDALHGERLPARPQLYGLHAGPSRRRRSLRRRQRRRGRHADRRRWVALDRAPALPARCRAALCRLCGLARGPAGGHPAAGDPPRPLCHHDVLPAARRAVRRLSDHRTQR